MRIILLAWVFGVLIALVPLIPSLILILAIAFPAWPSFGAVFRFAFRTVSISCFNSRCCYEAHRGHTYKQRSPSH